MTTISYITLYDPNLLGFVHLDSVFHGPYGQNSFFCGGFFGYPLIIISEHKGVPEHVITKQYDRQTAMLKLMGASCS